MNFHYIDAENVGLNTLQQPSVSAFDRYFVFTKCEHLKKQCNNELVSFVSDYPTGPDQADFRIIAHLSNVLSSMAASEKKQILFCLHSQDLNLQRAFENLCSVSGVKFRIVDCNSGRAVNSGKRAKNSIKNEVLELLITPMMFSEVKAELGINQNELVSSFNELVNAGMIKRQKGLKSKKYWIRARFEDFAVSA